MQTARSTWDEWMTGDVVETLRRSVGEHATLAAKKCHQLKILNRFLVVLVLRPSSVGGLQCRRAYAGLFTIER